MDEKIKKWLSIFIAIIVVFVSMYSCGKIVNAEIPSTQKVEKHISSWVGYPFDYVLYNIYFTIDDTTGIPAHNSIIPRWFYTTDNVTFQQIDGLKLLTTVWNSAVGIIFNNTDLQTVAQAFYDIIDLPDNNNKAQGALYDSNSVFLGYCLNDISGCYWYENSNSDITIPDPVVDDIHNFTDYYLEQQITDDFFTFYPLSNTYILNNFFNASLTQEGKTYFNEQSANFKLFTPINVDNNHKTFFQTLYGLSVNGIPNTTDFLVCTSNYQSNWNYFCAKFKEQDNQLLATDMIDILTGESYKIEVLPYDSNNNQVDTYSLINLDNRSSTNSSGVFNLYFGNAFNSSSSIVSFPCNNEITVYKTLSVKQNLDNQDSNYDYQDFVLLIKSYIL